MSEIRDQLTDRLAIANLLSEVRDLRAKVDKVTRAQDSMRTRLPESAKFELENSDGDVVARLGGSDTGEVIEYVDGPTPNPPLLEADMLSAGPGQISVRSEGLDIYEDPAPKDFHALRVHVSLDPLFEPSDATAQGRLSTPKGVAGVTVEPGLWHVGLEYETKSGKLSGLSEVFEIEVEPLVDADEIQEALDEAQERLEEAEKDFQEGNDQRKQEIENLRDNVIPDLREALEEGLSDEVTRLEGMITTAGGTSILRGVGEPVDEHDPAELPAGAYYFQYDTLNAEGQLEGIWVVVETETGNEWSQSELDEVILPQVHLEQGTYGELHGGRLIANSIETSALAVNDWENLIVDSDLRELRSAELMNESNKISTQWASVALSGNHWTAQETNSGRTYIVAPEDDQWSILIFTKSGVGIPATAGESFLISMEGEGEITDVTIQVAGMDENYRQTFSINAIEGASLGAEFQTEFTIPEETSTGLPTEMIQFAIVRDSNTTGSGRWRITQFRRKTPGVLIEDGAVKAQNVDVEDLFADSAVIDKIWADIVRAKMLTAEEAFIGGALIRDNTIDVEKINVTEELTAAIGQFLRVKADMLEANAIDGMTITGSTMQTMAEEQRGIKMRAAENDLVAYDSDGTQSFHVDGNTGQLTAQGAEFLDGEVIGGYVGTAKTGKRVYLEGDNLTARDTANNVSARFSPDGISLLDGAGNLQDIGKHIYGSYTHQNYVGFKGASTPLGTATAYGDYHSFTSGTQIWQAVSDRYRCDVSFNILAHGRTAGSDGWIEFWHIPVDPDTGSVAGGSFFRREIYIGAPMFDVSLNYSMTQISDLPGSLSVGDFFRSRWQIRNRGLSLCQISNVSITLTPA